MIYTFRLSKISGNSHTFTIGKEIIFDKMTILGVQFDSPDKDQSTLIGSAGEQPLYLYTDILDHDNVIFNNGKAASITANMTHLIPLSTIATALPDTSYRSIDGITIIDKLTTFNATDTITWAIKEIAGNGTTVTNASADTLYGIDTLLADAAQPVDRGINIVCYFHLQRDSHAYSGDASLADSI